MHLCIACTACTLCCQTLPSIPRSYFSKQDLEKDTERMSQTQEKLRSAECEIRTLKTFLTTKTAMIEKRKKELRETKTVVSELLEKDQRRAFILADVLEKTARQYQHQVGPTGSKRMQLEAVQTPMEIRYTQYSFI